MGESLTEDEVRELVRQKVAELGSQRLVAQWLGLSPAFLNDMLEGKRTVGTRIPTAFGLRKVVRYERVEEA